jgi:xanthine dehydrogenase accessory factor
MLIVIKGAGDVASGIALRLKHAGFDIVMTEIERPLAVRRAVSFAQAVYDGSTRVEDIIAVLVQDEQQMADAFARNQIAVFVDPAAEIITRLKESSNPPHAVVDAIMAKRNSGTTIDDAPVVIGIGPGFTAGVDCHAAIETMRGHTLGRVITTGSALPDTGIPGEVGGYSMERLLRAPESGIFTALAEIGATVRKGDTVALVNSVGCGNVPLYAGIDGIVRGLLPSGIHVTQGMKAGDIDPRCDKSHCFTVSDKALAVAGGVLEALLRFSRPVFHHNTWLKN